ncbi:hypothetical protein BC936DRAFT_150120, partial [Jimgerdemannia flammicorona]
MNISMKISGVIYLLNSETYTHIHSSQMMSFRYSLRLSRLYVRIQIIKTVKPLYVTIFEAYKQQAMEKVDIEQSSFTQHHNIEDTHIHLNVAPILRPFFKNKRTIIDWVNRFIGRAYVMDLLFDGIYHMIMIGEFEFPQGATSWGTMLGCYQVLSTIQ